LDTDEILVRLVGYYNTSLIATLFTWYLFIDVFLKRAKYVVVQGFL